MSERTQAPLEDAELSRRPASDEPRVPPAAAGPLVPDVLSVDVAPGGRLFVLADLRLRRIKSEEAVALSNEMARVIESIAGPCTLVFAGDTFDLAADAQLDPTPVLATHQRLADAIGSFAAGENRRVVVLPGSRDAALAWHEGAVKVIAKRLGADVALAVDARVVTGSGEHRIRVDPGARFDPIDARDDARDPAVVTLGDHARRMLDNLATGGGGWLDGLDLVPDPVEASSFVSSRLFYRRIVRRFGWMLLPFVVAIGLLIVGEVIRLAGHREVAITIEAWAAWLAIAGVVVAALSAVFAVIWWWTLREPLRAVSLRAVAGVSDDGDLNAAPRSGAGRLLEEGYRALVTAHTGTAELTDLGVGFYANVGTCGEVAVRREGRLGAPDVWSVEQHWSWVTIEAGADLAVRLHLARRQPPTTTFLERVLSRAEAVGTGRPEVVGEWPSGRDWPLPVSSEGDRRRARRIGAFAIAAAGLMNLISALLPPLRVRLDAIEDVMPLAVAQAAAMLTALVGLLLLLLGRGIRRGQRHAWIIAEVALVTSIGLNFVKGLDFEEAIIAAGVALYLFAKRRYFRVRADDVSVLRGITVLITGLAIAVAVATVMIEMFPGRHRPRLGWSLSAEAAAQRLVGVTTIRVAHHVDRFLVPVMVAVAIGLVVYAGWLLFSPVVAERLAPAEPDDAERARDIVRKSSGGTLAYFALRDDKRWFFHGGTLVAYAVSQGVALVSPDPLGPVGERRPAWFAFRQFADEHGWSIAVMGASEEWLPIYRASGMHELYVGDEAVVDVRRFTLDGPRNKAVRQAVNRVANKGYTITFEDPAQLDPDLEAQLRGLMTESRRGEMERGFSMTLGRVFDPRDTGLLLAVCSDGQGQAVAFCQFVPAPGIHGYSLDLMRRSESTDHPNGLTDFVLASTILYLKEEGYVGLGLNFATMRGVLAGERGDSTQRRFERWTYRKMSDSMQIESLWHYNAKFDPDWVPRYACYDAPESLISSATALAKAESWWEIPVIGRFFKPGGSDSASLPSADVPDNAPVGSGEDPEPLVPG